MPKNPVTPAKQESAPSRKPAPSRKLVRNKTKSEPKKDDSLQKLYDIVTDITERRLNEIEEDMLATEIMLPEERGTDEEFKSLFRVWKRQLQHLKPKEEYYPALKQRIIDILSEDELNYWMKNEGRYLMTICWHALYDPEFLPKYGYSNRKFYALLRENGWDHQVTTALEKQSKDKKINL